LSVLNQFGRLKALTRIDQLDNEWVQESAECTATTKNDFKDRRDSIDSECKVNFSRTEKLS